MTEAPIARPRRNLKAAAIVLVASAALLFLGFHWGRRLEQRYIHILTPELGHPSLGSNSAERLMGSTRLERLKNQGMTLQSRGFAQHDLLPLYGSSELNKPVPGKASLFFREYPSGFAVFPVGKAGATSLILLQKIGAVGTAARGRKVAISLSPAWFTEVQDVHAYRGNFSHQQASAIVFCPLLSEGLKRDVARRMLDFPIPLEDEPLLRFAVGLLARDTTRDRLMYTALQPLGRLENFVYLCQDHLESTLQILSQRRHWDPLPRQEPHALAWPQLLAEAEEETKRQPHREFPELPAVPNRDGDEQFLLTLANAKEWGDLELLLRMMKELKVEPLLLSMPMHGFNLSRHVSPEAIAEYPKRLYALADQYGAAAECFEDHVTDPFFLIDFHDHMTTKGWMYYNQALDEFYHGRNGALALYRHGKAKGTQ